MTTKNEKHLRSIILTSANLISKKYRKGAKEHGGNLLDKAGIIYMAIEEAVDQIIYLLTLKEQIDTQTIYKVKLSDKK